MARRFKMLNGGVRTADAYASGLKSITDVMHITKAYGPRAMHWLIDFVDQEFKSNGVSHMDRQVDAAVFREQVKRLRDTIRRDSKGRFVSNRPSL